MNDEQEVGLENIYLQRQSASSFITAIHYDAQALSQVAHLLADHQSRKKSPTTNILDIGTGPGSFILPIIETFERDGQSDYQLDCLDVSQHMARLFDAALAATDIKKEKVRYLLGDAEQGLGEFSSPRRYDLIFATFVLHYIKNWPRLLDEMVECLSDDGLIVQAQIIGDFRNLDGQFDVESPILFRQFWGQYFTERAKYASWPPAISVSDLSVAFTYLRRRKRLKLFREDSFLWNTDTTWDDLCGWIADAPLSSLGAGLFVEDRRQLARVMREWLEAKNIRQSAGISLRWGIKVICLNQGK